MKIVVFAIIGVILTVAVALLCMEVGVPTYFAVVPCLILRGIYSATYKN